MARNRNTINQISLYLIVTFVIFLLASCSTVTHVENPHSGIPAKPGNCKIHFFNTEKPKREYITVSKIESHIEKNFFFGGTVSLEDEAYEELSMKTCKLGGDAVIIDDFVETSVLEFSHVHVWATAIKFID